MVRMRDVSVVSGNNVLAPKYEPVIEEQRQQEELQKAKEFRKTNREKRVKSKAKIILNIGIAFVVGVVLIYRYVVLYNMRQELTNAKSSVVDVSKENENLKVLLVKASSIENVEKVATEKLHMVRANKNQVVYGDLTKGNFVNTSKKNNEETEVSFWQKILNKLF